MQFLRKYIRLIRLIFTALKYLKCDKLSIVLSAAINESKQSNIKFELERVSKYIGISTADLQLKTRKREIVEARQVAMYLAKQNTNESLAAIGFAIGKKDHATVLHACKVVTSLLDHDRNFRAKWMPLITNNNT